MRFLTRIAVSADGKVVLAASHNESYAEAGGIRESIAKQGEAVGSRVYLFGGSATLTELPLASQFFSEITVAFKTTFEVFTRVDSDNSLERLTEGSARLVTDRSSNVYELFVTLL